MPIIEPHPQESIENIERRLIEPYVKYYEPIEINASEVILCWERFVHRIEVVRGYTSIF